MFCSPEKVFLESVESDCTYIIHIDVPCLVYQKLSVQTLDSCFSLNVLHVDFFLSSVFQIVFIPFLSSWFSDNPDHYQLYVEGACLTFLKEGESSNVGDGKVNRAGSFTHIVDSQGLPDQGTEPFRLKSNLSFRMQGISTSRILSLM